MHCTKRRRTHTRATKLAYFGACAALFSSGAGSMMLLAAGILDVVSLPPLPRG